MGALHSARAGLPSLRRLLWLSGLLLSSLPMLSQAQITLDGSLGPREALRGPNYTISDRMGQIRGANLFHSFGQFNLAQGESATFTGPATISNILSRVTGGSPSSIDGTIRSQIPGAHLYLLNPSGVLLGPNASLDVSGSFHVSTADYLRLADGVQFHANLSRHSVLTVAPPAAFGFLSPHPAAMAIQRSGLEVPAGQTLSFIGGDIDFVGDPNLGFLHAPGGRINLASVASPGEVTLGDPNLGTDAFARLGNITISQEAGINVNGRNFDTDPAGTIVIRGGQLLLSDTFITARGNPGGLVRIKGDRVMLGNTVVNAATGGHVHHPGTAVDMQAQGAFVLVDGEIAASSFQAGRAGDIRIKAGSIHLGPDDPNATAGNIGSRSFGSGPTGNVELTTPGSLLVQNGFFVGTRALSSGNGGNVTVRAGRLEVRDGGGIDASALIGEAGVPSGNSGTLEVVADAVLLSAKNATQQTGLTTQSQGTGNAGALRVTAGSVQVLDGAEISAALFDSSGQGAALEVNAKTIVISGTRPNGNRANISGSLSGTHATGTGSAVHVRAERLQVTNGGLITTRLLDGAPGNAGNITIRTGSLDVTERGTITADAFAGTGNAGTLEITATDVRIAGVSAATDPFNQDFTGFSTLTGPAGGNAGNMRLTADSLVLTQNSTIKAISRSPGRGGTIEVHARSVQVLDGANILASAFGSGQGGKVAVTAESVVVSGVNSSPFVDRDTGIPTLSVSGIGSQAGLSSGGAGDVRVMASRVEVLDGGSIASDTFGAGNGGNIDVMADSLVIAGVNPGLRDLLAMQGIPLAEASELASAGIRTGSNSIFLGDRTTGSAGNVRVQAGSLHLRDGGTISARTTGPGVGGNIELQADRVMLASGAAISSESSVSTRAGTTQAGKAGSIAITAQDTFHSDNSRVTAASDQAEGGTISITAGQVQLSNGAAVTAETTGRGNAGNVTITTQDTFLSTNGSVVTRATQADGGNIQITALNFLRLRDSAITAEVGGGAQTVGGNITIDPQFVVLQNSQIVANAFQGRGGNIQIQAQQVFLADPASLVSASSALGINGQVAIQAPVTSISGAVAPLPQAFAQTAELLRTRCAERLREGTVSRLVVGGRDGVPLEPGSLLLSPLERVGQEGGVHAGERESHPPEAQPGRAGYAQAPAPGGLEVECARWLSKQGTTVIQKRSR